MELGQREVKFGYDLDKIDLVDEYLTENYTESIDYLGYYGRGDDTLNSIDLMSEEILNDNILLDLINECDGRGDFSE